MMKKTALLLVLCSALLVIAIPMSGSGGISSDKMIKTFEHGGGAW